MEVKLANSTLPEVKRAVVSDDLKTQFTGEEIEPLNLPEVRAGSAFGVVQGRRLGQQLVFAIDMGVLGDT
jgi:hypothetical protein